MTIERRRSVHVPDSLRSVSLLESVPRATDRPGLLTLLALSVALVVAIALFFIATYPLWPRTYLSPVFALSSSLTDLMLHLFSTDLAHQAVDGTGGNVFFYLYALAALALFGVYLATLRYASHVRPLPCHLYWLVGTTAFAGLLLLFAPTLFTSDLYSYVMYGRMAAAYGANPLVTPPNRFVFDPVYPLVYWKDTVSVYGPVWVSISHVLMAAVPAVIGWEVAAFKLVALLFHLANVVLIWLILHRSAPRQCLLGAATYALNPLLLVEFAANGHNDVTMLFFMLLAALAIVRGHRLVPLVLLVLAVLTKWIAVFVLPIYLLAVLRQEEHWRRRAKYLIQAAVVMAIPVALLYLPYWAGSQTVTAMFDSASAEFSINSVPELILRPFADLLRTALPTDNVSDRDAGYALKAIFSLGFLVFWVRELLQSHYTPRVGGQWLRLLFGYLAIGCTWFWPWYISWLIPFAALNAGSRLSRASLFLSFSGLMFYSLWPGAPLRPFEPFVEARTVVVLGLPLLYLAIVTVREHWLGVLRSDVEVCE